jgi:hypothetical protein
MKESQFHREVINTFEDYGWWCYKIPDSIKTAETRFIPPKPCDLIAIDQNPILIECKILKKIGRINKKFFANTKEKKQDIPFTEYHQIKELKSFKDTTGNPAFYFINIRIPYKINELIIIEIDELIAMFEYRDYLSKESVEEKIELAIPGYKKMFKSILFEDFLDYCNKI